MVEELGLQPEITTSHSEAERLVNQGRFISKHKLQTQALDLSIKADLSSKILYQLRFDLILIYNIT